MQQGASNPAVRAAVEAFAAAPSPATSVEVLRHCLVGHLLYDGTGSRITMTDDDPPRMAAGSTMNIATARGPDGRSALLAFTSQSEIQRVHEAGTDVISFVEPGPGVLELVRMQGHGWLYVDPAGPTCALSAAEIDFALRVPRNDRARAALEPAGTREELLGALRDDGQLLLAVEDVAGTPRVRHTEAPGGGHALMVFTSSPEVVARNLTDRPVAQTTTEVRERVLRDGLAGLVVNAAGPWAFVSAEELR